MTKLSDIKNTPKNTVILKGKEYEVGLNMNALCELEETFGSTEDAFKVVSAGNMKDIRTFLCIALKSNEGLEDSTEKDIGRLIEYSDVENILTAITNSINNTLPEADDTEVNSEDTEEGK